MGQGDIRATLWRSPRDRRSPRTAGTRSRARPRRARVALDGCTPGRGTGADGRPGSRAQAAHLCAAPRSGGLALGPRVAIGWAAGAPTRSPGGPSRPPHLEGEQASRASGRGAPLHPDPSRPARMAGGTAPRPGVPLMSITGPGAARQRRRRKREPGRYAHGLALNQPISGPQDATAPVSHVYNIGAIASHTSIASLSSPASHRVFAIVSASSASKYRGIIS